MSGESAASRSLREEGPQRPPELPYACRCGWRFPNRDSLYGHLSVSTTSHGPATPADAEEPDQ